MVAMGWRIIEVGDDEIKRGETDLLRKLDFALQRGRHATLKCKLYQGRGLLVLIAASSVPRTMHGT